MKWIRVSRMIFVVMILSVKPLGADIFEHIRPADALLREALGDDRSRYYVATPGVFYEPDAQAVSPLKKLSVDGLVRKKALYDSQTSLDMYLKEEFAARRVAGSDLPVQHPLVLLEYSSPVMADVMKHYRMSAYERLAMEQVRLSQIERSTETSRDRLSRQSERACLERNADKGLVAAMHVCMRATDPFDDLAGVDGRHSLQDGRRRIHVLAQAIERLGLDKKRVEAIVGMAGDKVIADGGYEDVLPVKMFDELIQEQRQKVTKLWHQALDKYRRTGRVGAATLEGLSLPGAPVTLHTVADMALFDNALAATSILKLAFIQASWAVSDQYGQAAGYVEISMRDPVLYEEFRRILAEKRGFLKDVARDSPHGIRAVESYKELLMALARSADNVRGQMRDASIKTGLSDALFTHEALMLNF